MFTIEEARKLAQGYSLVPIYEEMLADVKTPIQVIRLLKSKSKHCFLLESVEKQERWGRYTFIGYEPRMEISCINHELTIKEKVRGNAGENGNVTDESCFEVTTKTETASHPREAIREILSHYKSPRIEGLPSFTGGLVGYFSYDYLKYAEPSLDLKADDTEGFKDVDLMLFDKLIVFDNLKQKIYVIANIRTENLEEEYQKASEEIKNIVTMIKTEIPGQLAAGKLKSELQSLYNEEEFCDKVNRAKHYIREGDIFQVVLSNPLSADYEGSLMNAYRCLRTTNPSPYMFYFSSDDLEVAGASPETLVKLEDGTVYTFPLAGTRPRGATREEDLQLEKELLADEKELAEHNMLVDLGRNDLGKICEFGSVTVDKYKVIERYSHVMHIASTVKGSIREEKTALDAIEAVLPAGTLSGAPKLRAMHIIDELEKCKRGIYGGAIGYIDFTGNMDMCIAIRIAYKKNGKVYVRSGAGIVADSVPENEFRECINKAKAVVNALKAGEEEL